MKRNVVAITAGMLMFGLALTGCSSSEPTSQNTPEPSVTPTETVEPTETPQGRFMGQCLDIGIEYSLLMETLSLSNESKWAAAVEKTATFFGSDSDMMAVVVGEDSYESELVKKARGATRTLQYALKQPNSAGSPLVTASLDLVDENYQEFKDVCSIEIGDAIWW